MTPPTSSEKARYQRFACTMERHSVGGGDDSEPSCFSAMITSFQVGTINYMSPEAISDTSVASPETGRSKAPCMKVGRASDVWSLGCILYQVRDSVCPRRPPA